MGTRSLTIVKNDEGTKDLLTIYRQMDGYPAGHGRDLKNFLTSRVLVNGYGRGGEKVEANGMGCLAAQLISDLKTDGGKIGPGSIYVYPNGSKNCGEEYLYIIAPRGSSFALKVYGLGDDYDKGCTKLLYVGGIEDFDPDMQENS
jgi:hypothetical protein